MTDLSPAARAVLTAVTLKQYDVPPEGLPAFAEEMAPLIAAALRAAADAVIPAPPDSKPGTSPALKAIRWERKTTREQLLAIAAELEGNP
jgi:hypothetical protein